MIRKTLVFSALSALLLGGCASTAKPPPPVETGFLSTYRNLEQVDADSWRYLDPNNRLARYTKFMINPVELSIPPGAEAEQTSHGDLRLAQDYMRQALIDAVDDAYHVVDAAAWDVCEVRVALTNAFDKDARVGIAMEGEMIDSVSTVQIGALVESKLGRNLTITRFWTESDAKGIMDGWAARFRAVVDEAHAAAQ